MEKVEFNVLLRQAVSSLFWLTPNACPGARKRECIPADACKQSRESCIALNKVQEVPSLDLLATDSGTVAKSRDGSTAPSGCFDGACVVEVGECIGFRPETVHKPGFQFPNPISIGTAIRALNYRLRLIARTRTNGLF